MPFSTADAERFMQDALCEGDKARGRVSPNPAVGAILVQRGRIIASGHTQRPGSHHAEVMCLGAAGKTARGATMFVTLEPCCHHGRSGACTRSLIAAGVAEVFYAVRDPNPAVAGKGEAELRRAGIRVHHGPRTMEATRTHAPFFKWITHRLPFVTSKMAISLDGRIAAPDGTSQWLSGDPAQREVQELRAQCDAVMVGVGTVLADDPRLTLRDPRFRDHAPRQRIILDPAGKIPLTARVLAPVSKKSPRTIVFTGQLSARKRQAILDRGHLVIPLTPLGRDWNWPAAFHELAKLELVHILFEGGGRFTHTLLWQGLLDRLVWYVTPWLLGSTARPVVGGPLVRTMADRQPLRDMRVTPVGNDLRVEAEIAGKTNAMFRNQNSA